MEAGEFWNVQTMYILLAGLIANPKLQPPIEILTKNNKSFLQTRIQNSKLRKMNFFFIKKITEMNKSHSFIVLKINGMQIK